MRKAVVYVHNNRAGELIEDENNHYTFLYDEDYCLAPISLTMPIQQKKYYFEYFPPFFEGLLPEGFMLEGLLRIAKIDKNDYMSQLIVTGNDLVGAITVKELKDE